MDLSIVIPSYGGADLLARHLPALLEHLPRIARRWEVLVVDDGSADEGRTATVARSLGCDYLRLPMNQGKGAAVRAGMLQAQGRFRLYTDCDIPYELSCLERFVHYLDAKEFHIVVGDRTLPGSAYFAQVPAARHLTSRAFSFLVGRFVTTGLFDTQCGLKGFRDHVAEDLFRVARVDRFAFDVELLYVALKRNYDIKRLPVRLRSLEPSTIRMTRDGPQMILDLARIRTRQALGRYAPQAPVILTIDSSLAAPDVRPLPTEP